MKTSLTARILLSYLLVIGSVVLAALRSQQSLASAQDAAQRLSERSIQGIELAAELDTLLHERAYVSNYLLSHDPRFLADAALHQAQFQSWIAGMAAFAHTDPQQALSQEMRGQYLGYTAQGDEVIRLSQAGQEDEAKKVFFAMKAQLEGLLTNSQQLFALAEDDMRARRAESDAAITRERQRIFWLTALGAAASLLAGFLLARNVSRPIVRLALRLGAEGGVAQIEVQGDELGLLESQVNTLLERVRQQERALLQAEKLSELGELAAEVAHETLNPLAGARGMLQVLRRGSVPAAAVPEELAAVEGELRRVEEIVRRLMRYARPLEPHARPVLLAEVVQRAVRSAQSNPATQGHAIDIGAGLEVRCVVDPVLIEQVLVNLLVNACEASPLGAPVEVRARVEAAVVQVEVRDHGAGIPPDQRGRLFHPFFTTKPQGNGLGLAVSRNIVREHGGRLEATSLDQGGAVFTMELPQGEV